MERYLLIEKYAHKLSKRVCSPFCINHIREEDKLAENVHSKNAYNIFYKFIERKRCIDCIKYVIEKHLNLSFKRLKKREFRPWFKAIDWNRVDVLQALIEKGVGEGRYSEFINDYKRDSYRALRHRMAVRGDWVVCKEEYSIFIEIFWLFKRIGILSECENWESFIKN